MLTVFVISFVHQLAKICRLKAAKYVLLGRARRYGWD